MATIVNAVQHRTIDSVHRVGSGHTNKLGTPVQNQMKGIPVAALADMSKGDAVGTELLKKMIRKLKPSLHYQTIVGVLHSAIPTMFEESAADLKITRKTR
ncbi:MAG: hypothetical protein AB8B62_13060 [Roseobacter sp.]